MNSLIMSAPGMVAALAGGRKTQTRRAPRGFMVRVPEPVYSDPFPGQAPVCAPRGIYSATINRGGAVTISVDADVTGGSARPIKPFDLGVKPGEFHFVVPQLGADAVRSATILAIAERPVQSRWRVIPPEGKRLWVREALERAPDLDTPDGRQGAVYLGDQLPCPFVSAWPWKRDRLSPLYLPFGARRFELALGVIKLEHLQDITEEDAQAEGVSIPDAATAKQNTVDVSGMTPYRAAFACLWEALHGRGAWASNPWVFAFRFAVHDRTKEP